MGAKKIQYGHPALRWTSGGAGVLLLALTVFAGYGFLLTAYDNYVFFPKVKAEDHYVMPLRWQDIVAEFSLACLLVALLVLSVYLLRSAFLSPKITKALAAKGGPIDLA